VIPFQVKQIFAGYWIESIVHEVKVITEIVELFDGDRGNQIWITDNEERRRKIVEAEVLCVRKEII